MAIDTLHINTVPTDTNQKELVTINNYVLVEQDKDKIFFGVKDEIWVTSILIPSLAFLFGLLFSWYKTKRELLAKLNTIQSFYKQWIDLVKEPLEKQNKSFEQICSNLSQDKKDDNVKSVEEEKDLAVYPLTIENLKIYSPDILVQTFVTNKCGDVEENRKLLFKLCAHIDYLLTVQASGEKLLVAFNKFDENLLIDWNQTLVAHNTLRNDLLAHNKENIAQNAFLTELFKITKEWESLGTHNAGKYIKEKYLDLVEPLLKDTMNKTPDENVSTLLKQAQHLIFLYSNRKELRKLFSKRFKNLASDTKSAYVELKDAKDSLIALKFKPFYKLE